MTAFLTMLGTAATGVADIFVSLFNSVGSIIYDGTEVTILGWIIGIALTGSLTFGIIKLVLSKIKLK